jgi:hypothetical protein
MKEGGVLSRLGEQALPKFHTPKELHGIPLNMSTTVIV